jgi:hypothetical protein
MEKGGWEILLFELLSVAEYVRGMQYTAGNSPRSMRYLAFKIRLKREALHN